MEKRWQELKWLTIVLREYCPTFDSFEKYSKLFILSPFTVCLSFLHLQLEQIKHQQMAKMNDQEPKERLSTSRFNDFFPQNLPK